jgi:uncharacterized membrane protein YgcG
VTARRSVRWGARVLLPVAVGGGAVVLTAGAALAASTINVTDNGSSVSGGTLHSYASVVVAGNSTACTTALCKQPTISLYVTPPSGAQTKFASGQADKNGNYSHSYDLGCADGQSPCTTGLPPNGDYQFQSQDSAGAWSRAVDVLLAVAPVAPSAFHASVSGTVVTFSWAQNPEPDIDSYDVVDGTGADVIGGPVDATPGGACDASSCAVTQNFGSAAYGTSRTFSVVAFRHTAPRSSSTLSSDPSTAQSVNFPAAPAPASSPSSDPSSGGTGGGTGSTGGSGGTGTGSTGTGGSHTSGGPSGHHASADLSAALPSFSAGSVPNLPSTLTEVKPLPQGTFKPTLAYPNQYQPEAVKKPAIASQVGGAVVDALALKHPGVWRGLAAAAVLLLMTAHLRAWLARIETD